MREVSLARYEGGARLFRHLQSLEGCTTEPLLSLVPASLPRDESALNHGGGREGERWEERVGGVVRERVRRGGGARDCAVRVADFQVVVDHPCDLYSCDEPGVPLCFFHLPPEPSCESHRRRSSSVHWLLPSQCLEIPVGCFYNEEEKWQCFESLCLLVFAYPGHRSSRSGCAFCDLHFSSSLNLLGEGHDSNSRLSVSFFRSFVRPGLTASTAQQVRLYPSLVVQNIKLPWSEKKGSSARLLQKEEVQCGGCWAHNLWKSSMSNTIGRQLTQTSLQNVVHRAVTTQRRDG